MPITSLFSFLRGNSNVRIIILHVFFGGNDRMIYNIGRSAFAFNGTILFRSTITGGVNTTFVVSPIEIS